MLLEIPFERLLEKPITESGLQLLNEVIKAHDIAATTNQNCSSAACSNAIAGSGSFANGVASAILTLGKHHGPINDARLVYENFDEGAVRQWVMAGGKVPGFGNSFFKDSLDPAWVGVDLFLEDKFPNVSARIEELSRFVELTVGSKLCPNAALFTAAACSEIGLAHGFESALFIISRIPAWGGLCRS